MQEDCTGCGALRLTGGKVMGRASRLTVNMKSETAHRFFKPVRVLLMDKEGVCEGIFFMVVESLTVRITGEYNAKP
jgi:hypothetical protein